MNPLNRLSEEFTESRRLSKGQRSITGDTAARLKTAQQSLGRGLPLCLGKWKLDAHRMVCNKEGQKGGSATHLLHALGECPSIDLGQML